LLALCRKNLRKKHGFGKGFSFQEQKKNNTKSRKWRIPAVFSTETPKELPSANQKSVDASSLRRCDGTLGTACFVTGTFGFVAAAEVVSMLARGKLSKPRKKWRKDDSK
jgi:tRNA A37 threonylcarbamoyladenosine dehydratase